MLAGNLLWVILGVFVVGAIGASYVKGRSDGRALEVAERATMDEIARVSREAAIEAAGEKIAKIQVVNRTIYAKATHEIVEKPVYRDCRHDAVTFGLLNDALSNGAEPTGQGSVPGSDATKR